MISPIMFEVYITTQADCAILIVDRGAWANLAVRECVSVQGCAYVCMGSVGVTTLGRLEGVGPGVLERQPRRRLYPSGVGNEA